VVDFLIVLGREMLLLMRPIESTLSDVVYLASFKRLFNFYSCLENISFIIIHWVL